MTDLELINKVKTTQDNAALTELINQNTGIYFKMISKYALMSPKIRLDDLRDDKATNIYEFALSYNKDKEMKFSTYVADMTKYMCLNIINRSPQSIEFNENICPSNDSSVSETVNHNDEIDILREKAKKIDDPKFYKIFCLRFNGNKVRSWRYIGKKIGMTQEGARKLFNRHIEKLKHYAKT